MRNYDHVIKIASQYFLGWSIADEDFGDYEGYGFWNSKTGECICPLMDDSHIRVEGRLFIISPESDDIETLCEFLDLDESILSKRGLLFVLKSSSIASPKNVVSWDFGDSESAYDKLKLESGEKTKSSLTEGKLKRIRIAEAKVRLAEKRLFEAKLELNEAKRKL